MKISTRVSLAALLTGCVCRAEDPAPAPLPADRYATMAAQSPFALATAVAPSSVSPDSFAANWYVSGIARLGDADFVTIKSRDAALQFSLFGREPSREQGVSVASVNWSETIGKSTVILQKGTEMAKLEFNEAELRGPVVAGTTPTSADKQGTAASRRLPLVAGARPPKSGAAPLVTPNAALKQFSPGVAQAFETRRRERIIPKPR
jgi:hypothetical protein